MKNRYLVFIAIGAILMTSALFVGLLDYLCRGDPTIVQISSSPDGEYTAYVFESNMGATTGYVFHISVLKKEEKLERGTGNIFVCEDLPPKGIEWLDNRTLYIDDYGGMRAFKQKHQIMDVIVLYHSESGKDT